VLLTNEKASETASQVEVVSESDLAILPGQEILNDKALIQGLPEIGTSDFAEIFY